MSSDICILIHRINKESIVDVEGEIKSAAQKVQSCSQEDVEIFVDKVDITQYAFDSLVYITWKSAMSHFLIKQMNL